MRIKPEEIEAGDGVLTLSGAHAETQEDKESDFVRRERRYGAFTRNVPLPDGVDLNAITATTRDGVLEITVPLPEAPAKTPVTITPTAG